MLRIFICLAVLNIQTAMACSPPFSLEMEQLQSKVEQQENQVLLEEFQKDYKEYKIINNKLHPCAMYQSSFDKFKYKFINKEKMYATLKTYEIKWKNKIQTINNNPEEY